MNPKDIKRISRRGFLEGSLSLAVGSAVSTFAGRAVAYGLQTDNGSGRAPVAPKMVWKGDEGYEFLRKANVWNLRKPNRFPAVIVEAKSEAEVVAAVNFAREKGLQISPKGTGHHRNANFMRDGSMLLDLSGMTGIEVDAQKRIAMVQPGVRGGQLLSAITPHGLFFPTAHEPTVGISGYVMGGGLGWCWRRYGIGSASLEAVDVVTADGELIHSNDEINPDYIWCARGASSGMPGAVTKFYLRLQPLSASMQRSKYIFPKELWPDLTKWLMDIQPHISKDVEVYFFPHIKSKVAGKQIPTAGFWLTAMSDSSEQAKRSLSIFEECPFIDKALEHEFAKEADMKTLFNQFSTAAPAGRRYFTDSSYFNISGDQLVNELSDLIDNPPSDDAVFLLCSTLGIAPRPNSSLTGLPAKWMSFTSASSPTPEEDNVARDWTVNVGKAIEPYATGVPMMEQNFLHRPVKNILSPEKWAKYQSLLAKRDPDNLFTGFLVGQG